MSFIDNYNQKIYNLRRTKKYDHRSKSKFEYAKFVAWDGEGLQLGDRQVYGLLANSENDYIINVKGLSTLECFEMLTSNKYSNNSIHVCFGASYDINMILGDVPEAKIRQLHKTDKFVFWKNYSFSYHPRKSFTLRKHKMEIRGNKQYYTTKNDKYVFEKTIVLWDVFGFFQKKFVSVLKQWMKNTEYEEKFKKVIGDIEEGKQKRGEFTVGQVESFVLPYCLSECDCLRDLMHILHSYLQQAKIKVARWDGAGAIAAAVLKEKDIKKYIKIEGLDPCSDDIIYSAECAYFGGWVEGFMFGHILQTIYHYDLISAYPSANKQILSLVHGEWKRLYWGGRRLPLKQVIEAEDFPSFWLGHVYWKNGPLYGPGPFSWRNSLGSVSRPVMGAGWQWSPEIIAVNKVCKSVDVEIDEIYYFCPSEIIYPFSFIDEYFALRKEYKAKGIGAEKVIKLALNSLYGKLAQSLGYDPVKGIKPPYHSIICAGLITSITRARILEAVMQCPLAIVTIATDGIYSLVPLDLEIGKNLGEWEYTEHTSMTPVQPGFYWYSTYTEDWLSYEGLQCPLNKELEQHYYRGFNEGSISRERVIEAYSKGEKSLVIPTTRFITIGATIGLNDFNQWRRWVTKDRTLDLVMEKSGKRIWKGEFLPGSNSIRVSRVRVFDPQIFEDNPKLLESGKYKYEWDSEITSWQGQNPRTVAEEMYQMELSPDDDNM